MVVDHEHPALIVLRQGGGCGAGGGQAAGHGDIDQLIVVGQHTVPQRGHVVRGGLGGGDGLPPVQGLEELVGRQVHVLIIDGAVDDDGHGQNKNA